MRERLLISYHPERDYLGTGFNIIQDQITIGSGGWLGHGLTGSTQSQLDLLRVRTTDFIFAHAMGMFGFVGALALFLTFAILLWRTTHVVQATKDSFGQMMATGISAMIFFQAFVNIGMNVGLMPVTGIPSHLSASAAAHSGRCSRAWGSSRASSFIIAGSASSPISLTTRH